MRITPIDENKVNDGAWVDYMGVPLLIARANNDVFRKKFRQLTKPYQRQIDNDTLPETESEKILADSMAHGILVGWDKDKFPDGIEYSKEAAKELLLDDPDCRKFVTEFASQVDNFFTEQEEEDQGKS